MKCKNSLLHKYIIKYYTYRSVVYRTRACAKCGNLQFWYERKKDWVNEDGHKWESLREHNTYLNAKIFGKLTYSQ